MSRGRFKVIIVGGSVTGLTLAHSLQKIGVDYTILEKRAEVAPQEGASIGILPNGARVLDQLGLYDAIEQATAPFGFTQIHFPDGFHFTSSYPKKMLDNFGYPIAFLERRKLLEILYNALPDKGQVRVQKEVSEIENYRDEGKDGIRVRTADGDVYEGDLVVGADGVHSFCRSEMWRMSKSSRSNGQMTGEKSNLSVEYSCAFGISKGISKLKMGEQVMRIYNGKTLVVIPSRDGLVFWFLVKKLEQKYDYGKAPRFTPEHTATHCLELANVLIDKGIRFEDIWQKREVVNMVALEENYFQTWSSGRLVCIGDSMHKMTINLGQGANCAIEDVAVLSNLLHDFLKGREARNSTTQELDTLLRDFNRIRLPRVSHICSMSALTARVHARDGLTRKIIGRYIMPYLGEFVEDRPFKMIADAAVLEFLPSPRSQYPGWRKYGNAMNKVRPWEISSHVLLLLIALGMVLMYRQSG